MVDVRAWLLATSCQRLAHEPETSSGAANLIEELRLAERAHFTDADPAILQSATNHSQTERA